MAGKTTLFNVLTNIFGSLTIKSSGSSAAGIRQAIKSSSKVILCDEFESSKHRDEILERLRVSGRGDKILRGTTNQRGQGFGLQHIAWVAAIEVGLKRAPDRNRFIMLELTKPPGDRPPLKLPTPSYLADLGQRLLAVAIKYVLAARPTAHELKDQRVPGVDDRIVEGYSVPAAMLAVINEYSDDDAVKLLHEMLQGVDRESGRIADESDLMAAILTAHVHTGRETLSVGQLIDVILGGDTEREVAEQSLAKVGLRIDFFGEGDGVPAELATQKCLMISYQAVTKHLLRGTTWEHQSIDQILRRIPGAVHARRRLGGQRCRVVMIAKELLEREFIGRRSDERQVTAF